jgi:hypothetical protein
MSYDHLVKKTEQLKAEVAAILAEAEAIDQAEDEAFGADRRGDEIDPELSRRETRLAKMRVAMDAIETEAREKAAAKAAEQVEAKGGSRDEIAEATKRAVEAATPSPKAQRNFTDPDARIMKTADGSFHYTFNGQAVVDEAHQVVLSGALTQEATDVKQLIPMIEATDTDLTAAGIDGSPRVLLADAGYCSADNLEALVATGLDALVATGRLSHDEQVPPRPRGRIPKNATAKQRMARRLRTKSGKADYARRKVIVEPAFGQMKTRQHGCAGSPGHRASGPSTSSVTTCASWRTRPDRPRSHPRKATGSVTSPDRPASNQQNDDQSRRQPLIERDGLLVQTHAPRR